MNGRVNLLLLADGRFPSGQHAHSGGIEVAVRRGALRGLDDLEHFIEGRAHTTGLVDAAFAAAVVERARSGIVPWEDLDAEVSARMPSPAQRKVSRRLGRQLVRTASRVWPSPLLQNAATMPREPHQAVAMGAAAAAAGLAPEDAALAAVYASVTLSASAAVRMLGLDPVAVQALLARLASDLDAIAARAVAAAASPLDALPAAAAPSNELAAEEHQELDGRLFTS